MLVLLPALPGLAWAGMMRLIGVHDAFFTTGSPEARLTRAGATVLGMAGYLHVAPLALAVLLAGCWFLRADRQRAGLANPVWLWICCLGSLAIIFVTYVFGDLEIHGWLLHSVNRTTIFAQVVLYTEIAVWMVIAAEGAFGRTQLAPIAIRPQPASTCRKYSTIPASPSRSDTLGSRPGRRGGRFRAMAAHTRDPDPCLGRRRA